MDYAGAGTGDVVARVVAECQEEVQGGTGRGGRVPRASGTAGPREMAFCGGDDGARGGTAERGVSAEVLVLPGRPRAVAVPPLSSQRRAGLTVAVLLLGVSLCLRA